MVVAQAAWDLQQLSGGRFQLGLGTQVKGHNELRYQTAWTAGPGPRLREYLLCLKAIFQSFQHGAEPRWFEGEHYRFKLLPPFFNPGPIAHAPPPLYIAAVNTYMARLGGELCEGLRLHPIGTFAYVRDVVLPAIAAGAAKAGRTLADVDVVGAPFLALGETEADVARAMQKLKQHVAFYASTRTYHTVLARHGWESVGRELHQLSRDGKWGAMASLISDDMLREWAIVATWDRLAAEVKRRCAGIFTTVLLDLPAGFRDDDGRVRALVADLHRS
jgi:probable F420-dependent oxidoreductase